MLKTTLLRYNKELRTKDYPREEVINCLKELRNILMTTHIMTKRKSFFYNSTKDLLQSQLHLLELGFHCVQIADYADYQLRCYYYNILTLLFLRGEFTLENLRFRGNASGTLLETKQKIGLQFQNLLYKALLLSLCKLSIKGLTSDQQEFVETFLATAFFRVPEFRGKVLESLYRESDEYIEEWKQFSLDQVESKGSGMYNLFNWTEEFYAFLPSCKEKTESAEYLDKILRLTDWKRQMHVRGVTFFKFVAHWVRFVSHFTANEGIPWQDIPGYTGIVKALLNEMLHRDVVSYPEVLKDAINALLVNENMLTVFIKIVFQKTPAYDYMATNETLELVNSWFQTVCVKYGKVVPSNFDFTFFFKGIDILMGIDNPMGCEKGLWLIYNIAHLLPSNFIGN